MWLRQQLKNKWSAFFFKGFLFTLPFQSAVLIYESVWGKGFSNPYTSLSFSMAEGFLLLSTFFFLIENKGKGIQLGKKVLFGSLLFLLSTGVLSLILSSAEDSILKFFLSIGLLETLLVYFLVVNKVLKVNQIFRTLTWSMSFQGGLAFLQFIFGHSLGLGILGEPYLAENVAHLARLSFEGFEVIRSYGTFAHPNILGGFLALSILGTLLYPPESNKVRNLLLVIQVLGLICSFSRSALLGLILAVVILSYRSVPLLKESYNRKYSYAIFFLVFVELFVLLITRPLPLLSDPAVQTRLEGYEKAFELVVDHPLGVGWSLETLYLDENTKEVWMPWEYQPTHNIFLLLWVETGILGLVAFLLLIYNLMKKLLEQEKILGTQHEESKKNFFLSMGLLILFTGCLDHYWLTLEPARFLALIVYATISRFLSDPIPIKAIKSPKKLKPSLAHPK